MALLSCLAASDSPKAAGCVRTLYDPLYVVLLRGVGSWLFIRRLRDFVVVPSSPVGACQSSSAVSRMRSFDNAQYRRCRAADGSCAARRFLGDRLCRVGPVSQLLLP